MKNLIMTNNSIKYTINRLFRIANPKGNLIYNINVCDNKKVAIANLKESHKRIIFNLVDDSDWHDLVDGNCRELHWIHNSRERYKIPILFWVNKDLPFACFDNNEIVFNGDIISSSFFMLSRWEEKHNRDFDVHGRFKYENSIACKHGFITIPIVDEYAMLLRKYLQVLFPNIDLGKNKFSIKLSHDIDDIRRFKSLKHSIRTFGGDLLKTKSLNLFIRSLLEYKSSFGNPEKDPYFLAIYELARLSTENNIESAFYFKTSDKSDHDSGYVIDDYIEKCINNLQEHGFEIGFHPGYYTYKNYNRFLEEKTRLDKVLGYTCYGGRQHYLRFDINTTWNYWEKAGLQYDSTLGYAEHEGFRCGTCHPFRPFNIEENRELDIIEIPLIVMDGTLQLYRGMKPEEGWDTIFDLMNKCKEVEGIFTLLWHNTSVNRGWGEWFERVYKKVLVINGGNYEQFKSGS